MLLCLLYIQVLGSLLTFEWYFLMHMYIIHANIVAICKVVVALKALQVFSDHYKQKLLKTKFLLILRWQPSSPTYNCEHTSPASLIMILRERF